jgi:hypothetical protein
MYLTAPAHQSVYQYLNNALLLSGWRRQQHGGKEKKLPRLSAAYSYTCSRSPSHIKASLIMLAYGSSMPQEGRKTRHTGSRQQTAAAAAAGHLNGKYGERSASLHIRNLFLSPKRWVDKTKIF